MRYFALLATISAAAVGTSYALVDPYVRPVVDVTASGYDERTSYPGCSPDGCIPENTRDGSRSSNSRWSCKGDILDSDDEGCWIEYLFHELLDIVELRIAFYRGTEDVRTLNVYDNDAYHSQIQSSGDTDGYQTFHLHTDQTHKLRLHLDDWESNSDMWLSLTEVKFMEE